MMSPVLFRSDSESFFHTASAHTSAYKADKYSTGNIRFSWQTAGEHKPDEKKNFLQGRYTNRTKKGERTRKRRKLRSHRKKIFTKANESSLG